MLIEYIGYIGPILVINNAIKFGLGIPRGVEVDWVDCTAYNDSAKGAANIAKKQHVKVVGEYKEQQYVNQYGIVIPIQKFVVNSVELVKD